MDKTERLMSLDALRGFDMLWIMGFSGVVVTLCTMLGAKDCWLARQMTHVAWHGFRHHDTIFPLFLFLAGVSWPFSYASQVAKGRSAGAIVLKCLRRLLLLSLLGLVAGRLLDFKFANLRYDTVLVHIGFCGFVSSLLYMFVRSWKVRLALVFLLMAAHWLVLSLFTAPDAAALLASTDPAIAPKVASYAAFGTDNFSFTGNIAGWIDRTVMPGRLYETVFDPDGLLAKLTGVALAMLGVLAGEVLRRGDWAGNRKSLALAGAGLAALALMCAWMPVCPVNKKLWTATFVLAAAGYSFLMLALFHWIVDVRGYRKWTFFFRVIGMNSITIYMLMRLISFNTTSRFLFSGVASWGNGDWANLVFLLGQVALEWLVLWYFYRKGTFLRV